MQCVHDSPCQIPQQVVVLILARTVVTVQVHLHLTNPVIGEEMVQVVNNRISSLGDGHSFVNQ